MFDPEI